MKMTATTKQIIDNNINNLKESCRKRTDDPELFSIAYTELLKLHRISDMPSENIPFFIDSVVNMNYYYNGSKYHNSVKNEKELNRPNFVDITRDDDMPIDKYIGERTETMEMDDGHQKYENIDISDYDNRSDVAIRVVDEAFTQMTLKDAWYYKILFKKYFIENYTYQQIQDMTNIPKQSVHNAVRKALNEIYEYIDDEYGGIDGLKEYLND